MSHASRPLNRSPRPAARRRPIYFEQLEDRILMTVRPLDLVDPSLYGISALKAGDGEAAQRPEEGGVHVTLTDPLAGDGQDGGARGQQRIRRQTW